MPENLNPEHQLEYLKELRKKYEAVLADAQKTGDYSEAEKLKEELEQRLTELEALFPKPDENNIEKIEKGETTLEKAKEIMGEDYFGTEAIKKAFEINVGIYPIVSYSEAELERAKKNNEMLVYRVKFGLTMEGIVNRVKLAKGEGRLLFDRSYWFLTQGFFKNQNPRAGWALVSKDIIPDSTSQTYIEQTRLLRDHLNSLGSLTEDELSEVTDLKLDNFVTLDVLNSKAVEEKLVELKINKNHRRTPVEALYDFVIRFKNTSKQERMLESNYEWTNTIGSDGIHGIVEFGFVDLNGAIIARSSPAVPGVTRGVISVR